MEVPINQEMVLKVLTSDYNFFDQMNTIEILNQAIEFLDVTYEFEFGSSSTTGHGLWDWWGEPISNQGAYQDPSGHWLPAAVRRDADYRNLTNSPEINEIKGIVQNWLGLLNNADHLETATQQVMTQGQAAYINACEGGDAANNMEFGTTNTDFGVEASNTFNMYFVGRCVVWESGGGHLGGNYGQISVTTNDTEYVFNFSGTQSPLVLDMDGDGKLQASGGQWLPHRSVVDRSKMVPFDMDGDGFDEWTEWVGPNDGLLIQYNSGKISIKNLFGTDGGSYKNGFEKLSLLDTNKDGKLMGDELSSLSVWQDKNGNAKVDPDEIASVTALGITEISTQHNQLVSSFVQNGVKKTMWDWYPRCVSVKKQRK
jgi:hypothetical protein